MSAATRTSRAISGIATSFFQYFVLIALQIVVTPIILHIGGKEVLGGYSFIMQVVNWAGMVDLGFGVAIGRALAQSHGLNDQHAQFRLIFTTGRSYYVAVNAVFAVIVAIAGLNMTRLVTMSVPLQSEASLAMYLLAIYTVLRSPLTLFNEALNATQNMAAGNIIGIFGTFLRLSLSILFIYLKLNLLGLMAAYVIGDAVTGLIQRIMYHKKFPADKMAWGFPDTKLLKEMIFFGLTYLLMQLAGRLTTSTDSLLVGFTMGAASIAIYYTTQMPGTLLYQLIWKIADNVQAGLNELFAKREYGKIKEVYIRVLKYTLSLAFGLALGLVAFNEFAIRIWVGPDQFAGSFFTLLLAIYAIIQAVFFVNNKILIVFGTIRTMSLVSVVTGIIKIGLGFCLLKFIGLPGILLAFILGDTPNLLYSFVKVFRLISINLKSVIFESLLPALLVISAPGILVASLSVFNISLNIHIFVITVSGYCLIWLVSFYFYALSDQEKVRIRLKLHRRGSK